MALIKSSRMAELLKTRISAAFDCASHCIHMAEDYGPAEVEETARKMFELGEAAHVVSKDVFCTGVVWGDEICEGSIVYVYLMASSEDDACAQVASWDEGEGEGGDPPV